VTEDRDIQTTPEPGAETTASAGYERSDRAAQKRSRAIRLGVLGAILVAITAIGVIHQYGDIKIVGVDALCPFGGIETLWSLIAGGTLIQRISASSVILLGVTLVIAVVFRRSFCGYLCPLGALQEFFGKIGKAIWPRNRPVMPAAIDKPARLLKYGILVFFTVWTWQAATLVIRPYDPWVAWMHLTSAEVFAEFSRVLAPNCRLGMAEPGIGHAETGHSQAEMDHGVLERELRVESGHLGQQALLQTCFRAERAAT